MKRITLLLALVLVVALTVPAVAGVVGSAQEQFIAEDTLSLSTNQGYQAFQARPPGPEEVSFVDYSALPTEPKTSLCGIRALSIVPSQYTAAYSGYSLPVPVTDNAFDFYDTRDAVTLNGYNDGGANSASADTANLSCTCYESEEFQAKICRVIKIPTLPTPSSGVIC